MYGNIVKEQYNHNKVGSIKKLGAMLMNTSMDTISEVRAWTILLLSIIGAGLTIKTFIGNNRQRKLDNTFKTLDFLRKHISQKQIDTFIYLFHANNPLGVAENEFRLKDGRIDYVETMFSEGGCGNGDIHNMIEVFNLVSKSLSKGLLEDELIWYEYGQIMLTCYKWTKYLEENKRKNFFQPKRDEVSDKDYKKYLERCERELKTIHKFYADFNKYIDNIGREQWSYSTKYYTYIE